MLFMNSLKYIIIYFLISREKFHLQGVKNRDTVCVCVCVIDCEVE